MHLAFGPDGNLWLTLQGANAVGRLTPGGQLTTFPLPQPKSYPNEIVAAPDGAMWFSEPGAKKVGRITMSGELRELFIGEGQPTGLVVGPDGNLWATAGPQPPYVIRITPAMEYTAFILKGDGFTQGSPSGITVGGDGNLWIGEPYGRSIARVTTTGQITHFPLASESVPFALEAGPDGNVWWSEDEHIGRITPTGEVTLFATPDRHPGFDLAVGPDGDLYRIENAMRRLSRTTMAGDSTVVVDLPGYPTGIVRGPDDHMWIALYGGDMVARVRV